MLDTTFYNMAFVLDNGENMLTGNHNNMNPNLPFTTSMLIQDSARVRLFQSQPFQTSIEYAVQ